METLLTYLVKISPYWLLEYTRCDPVSALANPFLKLSSLKDRIAMLYKNHNSKWVLGKYLAVALLIGFVATSMAFKPAIIPGLHAQTPKMIKVKGLVVDTDNKPSSNFLLKIADAKMEELPSSGTASEAPSFPGGLNALQEFIGHHATYPVSATRANVQGKALISFVVSATGEIQNVEILKSPRFGLEEASKQLLAAMPAWIPGQKDGKSAVTPFTLTIDYRLATHSLKAKTIEAQVRPDGAGSAFATVTCYFAPRNRSHSMVSYFNGYGNSYGLQDALYVLNGTPLGGKQSLGKIPADQIATINIVKGAAAQKLYGNDGANGVVAIVTKSSAKNR